MTTAGAAPGILWVEMVAMILGRLEFFTVFLGLARLIADLPPILSTGRLGRSSGSATGTATAADPPGVESELPE